MSTKLDNHTDVSQNLNLKDNIEKKETLSRIDFSSEIKIYL